MLLETVYLPKGDVQLDRLHTELDSPSTLVLVFSGLSAEEVAGPIKAIRAAFPRSVISGCSTSGEVMGATVEDGGIAVAVAQFARTELSWASASVLDEGASYRGGVELARKIKAPSLAGALVFSDGLNINGSELVRGLGSELDESVVIAGGLAGDADRFTNTWVITDGEVSTGVVTAVGLHGYAVAIGHGTGSGWDIFGPPQVVTKAEANVVYTIDGHPALSLYEDSLGDLASDLPGSGLFFPLAMRQAPGAAEYVVRTLLAVNRADKSLIFAGDLPTGSNVQLIRANYPFDRLVEGAKEAGRDAAVGVAPAGPRLGIAISCVGRRLVLKGRVGRELEAALHGLPTGTRLVGFYSYGEISPLASGPCGLHNQTMTLVVLSER